MYLVTQISVVDEVRNIQYLDEVVLDGPKKYQHPVFPLGWNTKGL